MNYKNKLIFNADINLDLIKNHKIGIIGYGNQGKAHALNINDRKISLKIGIRSDSKNINKIIKSNIKYCSIDEVVKWADIISILISDKEIPSMYNKYIKPNLRKNHILLFAHGFNIHYKLIKYPKNINLIMVAPSGGGSVLRKEFVNGSGVPALIAVE